MLAWLPQTQVVLPLGSSDRLPVSAWPHLLPTWYSQRSLTPTGQVQALADPLCYFPSTRQPLVCSGTIRPLGTAAREGPTGPFCLSRIKNDLILNIIFWPLFSFRADHDPGETNTAQHSFVPERETGSDQEHATGSYQ